MFLKADETELRGESLHCTPKRGAGDIPPTPTMAKILCLQPSRFLFYELEVIEKKLVWVFGGSQSNSISGNSGSYWALARSWSVIPGDMGSYAPCPYQD
jgi:hypothetical protein